MKKDNVLVFLSLVLVIGFDMTKRTAAAEKPPDYTSRVPKYTFADTLEEQEAQLKTNPLMQRLIASRRKLASDRYRPIYHYVNPEGKLNDANGLCFWKGRWHLFYQAYPPEDPRQHWGHAVSTDLTHWRDLPYAIYPNPERACFSGTTLVEKDRVIAMYHGWTVGEMVAVSSDPLLLNWEKLTGKAVIPLNGAPNVHDPCIWKKDGTYYAVSGYFQWGPGGKTIRGNYLLRSKDLVSWKYLHPFVEGDRFTLPGDDGSCPNFWPIGDRHILLLFSHASGGYYLLGDYDKSRDKFVATAHGRFNFGPMAPSGVHAPSATPDGKGGIIVILNMNHGKPTKGWDQIMTLPRRLTLEPKKKGLANLFIDDLKMEPAGDIESLRYDHQHVGARILPANQEVVLEKIRGSAMELSVEIDPKTAPMVELNVLRSPKKQEFTRISFYKNPLYGYQNKSLITIESSFSSLLPDVRSRPPETAPIFMRRGEKLRLRVFIDRSVVEVFVNERQCLAVRVYPGREDSVGVSLRSQGRDAQLKSLDAWQMKNIYE